MKWRLGSCPACGGDLFEDKENEDHYTCLLCTRSYPATRAAGTGDAIDRVLANLPANLRELVKTRSRRARPGMAPAARPVPLRPLPQRGAPSGPRAA